MVTSKYFRHAFTLQSKYALFSYASHVPQWSMKIFTFYSATKMQFRKRNLKVMETLSYDQINMEIKNYNWKPFLTCICIIQKLNKIMRIVFESMTQYKQELFYLNIFIIIINSSGVCTWVLPACMSVLHVQCLKRMEEGPGSLGTGITEWAAILVLGMEHRSSRRTSSALDHWSIVPTLYFIIFC